MDRTRSEGALPAVLLVLATATFLWWIDRFIPIEHWLLFRYLRIWSFAALFVGASWCAGLRALSRLLPTPLRLGERLVLGFALGVLLFFAGVFAGGMLGVYGRGFFYLWPSLLLAWGGPAALREARRMRRHLRRFGFALLMPRGVVEVAAALALILGVVAVYMQVLTPNNVGADAVWYHLPIAEHYVAAGGIRRFREGWYNGALPQLASFLYAWAFQSPGTLLDHIALSAHLELVLFLATLASIAVLVRRLAGIRAPFAGGLMFVFSGFLMYDSNLIVGADHVLAFWAAPLALAILRLGRRFAAQEAALAGLITAGALLTKYQALYFLVPSTLIVGGLAIARRDARPFLLWGAVAVAAFSPHWLKNWIFYGDPLYPMLHRWFPAHPFPPGAAALMNEVLTPAQFRLTGTLGSKVVETLKVLVTFSFVPHDWDFHGARPVFGALYTCLLIVLPFARARKRVWLLVGGIELAVAVWFVTAHEDRYLQALLPVMVAVAAALTILVAHRGSWARAAVGLAVVVHAVAGDDVYFYRVHGMAGDAPVKAFVDYVALGQAGRFDDQARVWGNLQDNNLSNKVRRGSKLLAHHMTEKLGAGVESMVDGPGWQAAIDYLAQPTPASVYALWRRLGVTHVWWDPAVVPRSNDFLAREAIFQRAATLYVPTTEIVGHYRFGALTRGPGLAAVSRPTRLAWIGCGDGPAAGIYTPRDFAEGRAPSSRELRPPGGALSGANVVLRPLACAPAAEIADALAREFMEAMRAGEVVLYVRREG